MPRYIIERSYSIDHGAVPIVATRSKRIARDDYPEIVWEHSHVVIDRQGLPRSFCVYDAPSEDVLLRHGEQLGDHSIVEIYEIAGDVTPDDFPLVED